MTADSSVSAPDGHDPLFIVGLPRSGTTLLGMMLHAHPRIAIAPETHYLDRYRRLGDRRRCFANRARLAAFLDDLLVSEHVGDFRFDEAQRQAIRARVLEAAAPSHALILDTLLRTYAQARGKDVRGEKTPVHVNHLPLIRAWFPRALIIHVIRDVRDVLLSLEQVPWGKGGLMHNVRWWRWAAMLRDHEPALTAEHYLEVRYEDLLSDPSSVLDRVCQAAGVPYDAAMLRYHESSEANYDAGREPWKARNAQPLDAANQAKWKTRMSPNVQRIVTRLARTPLQRHGYEVQPVRLTPADYLTLTRLRIQNAWRLSQHYLARLTRRLLQRRA